jgi:hypothetical protein
MIVAGIGIIIGGILVAMYFHGEIGRPVVYRFPAKYRGWAGVRYDDTKCSKMNTEKWYLVISFDVTGRACTSSPPPGGWRYYRYEYTDLDGSSHRLSAQKDVWASATTGPDIPRIETLFVGSKTELEQSWPGRNELLREMGAP